jgi:dihydroxyacetone kinase-like predicted kinase
MLAFDASVCEETNAARMSEAAEAAHTVSITRAARDSVFDGERIARGEYMALLEDALISTGAEFGAVADKAIARLREFDPEFVTIFMGQDASDADADDLAQRAAAEIGGAEITRIYGGQPVYNFVIAAE